MARWYREFNAKWFDGVLPTDTDVLYAPEENCAAIANSDEGGFFIKINPALVVDLRAVKMALIHEMVHVKLWDYKLHGKLFQDEMKRLALAGAFKGLW